MKRSAAATKRRAAASPGASETLSREAWALIIQFVKTSKTTSLAEFDLTMAQSHLLLSLDPDKPAPMSEVASMLGCDASNVTGLVDRLEERGLIERRSADKDRRVKMVAVTTPGAKQRSKMIERWHAAPEGIANLPQTDLKELLRILKKASVVEV